MYRSVDEIKNECRLETGPRNCTIRSTVVCRHGVRGNAWRNVKGARSRYEQNVPNQMEWNMVFPVNLLTWCSGAASSGITWWKLVEQDLTQVRRLRGNVQSTSINCHMLKLFQFNRNTSARGIWVQSLQQKKEHFQIPDHPPSPAADIDCMYAAYSAEP